MTRNHPLIPRNRWHGTNGRCAFCGAFRMQERIEQGKGYVRRCKVCKKKELKPKVNIQGKIIAECYGQWQWILMYPDGQLEEFRDKNAAESAIRKYYRHYSKKNAINVGVVEWRYKGEYRP